MRHSVHLVGPRVRARRPRRRGSVAKPGLSLVSLGRVYRALAVVRHAGGHLDDVAIERTANGGLVAVHCGERVEHGLYAVPSVAAGPDRVGGRVRVGMLVEKVLDGIEDDVLIERRPSPSILCRCGHLVLRTAHPDQRRRRLGREPDYSAGAWSAGPVASSGRAGGGWWAG